MHCPCSSKYNRTHRYDSSGNRIISLPFSSPATRYVKRDTQYDIACKKLGCSFVRGYLHPDPSNCCISAPYRNPIAGCRTYLDCGQQGCSFASDASNCPCIQILFLRFQGGGTGVPVLGNFISDNGAAGEIISLLTAAEDEQVAVLVTLDDCFPVGARNTLKGGGWDGWGTPQVPTALTDLSVPCPCVQLFMVNNVPDSPVPLGGSVESGLGTVISSMVPVPVVPPIVIVLMEVLNNCSGLGAFARTVDISGTTYTLRRSGVASVVVLGGGDSGGSHSNCSGCPKAAINNVYKDNWAKSCAFPTSDPPVCYSPVIKKTQNKNGLMDYEYSYSTRQYLNRRCRTYKQQTFNFTSNTPADPSGTECCSNKYQANCACAPDCSGCRCELIPAVPACKVSNNSCCVTYKRSNQRFNKQGAVSGGSRINRLKYQTILKSQSVTPPTLYQDTPDIFANAVNGSMPVSLYRNTFPQYKKYIAGRRFARGINSGLVFQQPYGIPELTRRDRRTSERRRNALQN